MKKVIVLLCALLTLGVSASAVDIEYSGVVNSFTGEPAGGTITEAASDEDMIPMGGSCRYNTEEGQFLYRIASGAEISSTIASGMVTADPVSIGIPEGTDARLYRDGRELVNVDFSDIGEPGFYVLSITNSGISQEPLRFTIVNSVTGLITEYRLPDKFNVREALFNGEEMPYDPYRVDLTQEGFYQITYYCVPTGEVYELNIGIDHTPPVLALEAVVDGIAKGPVDISDLENRATIYIRQDGKQIGYTSVLRESGSYELTVKDEAGNSQVYKFMIQVYFNFSSLAFFILILAVAVAILVYIVRSRKSLRVR